ncbi:MAG: amidohydrolase, partial [Chloroflexi bacterium]|nr:amidohydrolase [Chloroflexota bacterium]
MMTSQVRAASSPGLLLVNGRIYTMDPAQPLAEAMAVQGSRILDVRKNSDFEDLIKNRGWEVVDLEGRSVLPGFIDSHAHLQRFALRLVEVNLEGEESKEEIMRIVAQRVKGAQPGEWITGRGWNQNLWGGIFPRKDDLDQVAPDNPVVLTRRDGHLLWANSLALRAAGINRNTLDPSGGEIKRDEFGEPTGILKEKATDILHMIIPRPTSGVREGALRQAIKVAQSLGITGIHNMVHDVEGKEPFSDFQNLFHRGELGLRVYMCIPHKSLEEAIAVGTKTGFGNEYLRLGHLKIFADGTLGSQTADMLEPFHDQSGNVGIEVSAEEELERAILLASQNDIACAIHAIGDRAVRRVLDAFERAKKVAPHLRHRIEHAQLLHPQDLPRFSQLGVIASMQPIHATSDMLIADKYWGSRARWSYAWKSLLKAGARVAFGSDSPWDELDPLLGVYAAVTRQRPDGTPPGGWYPEERISVEEAVYAYTMGAAYASGEDGIKGSLAPGKLADLVVLSQDIFRIPAQDILNTRVIMTVFDGRIVYR